MRATRAGVIASGAATVSAFRRHSFPQVGTGLIVLEPGGPMAMYHSETDQEDFLVLSGEALLIIEARSVRCGSGTSCTARPEQHVIVGAGEGPCVVLCIGARENHTYLRPDGMRDGRDDWGAYTVNEAVICHGAGVEAETTDAEVADARFPQPEPTRYRDGWLPDLARVSSA